MDAKELERLERNINSIKSMATTLHKKLLALFNFDGGSNFAAYLQQEHDNFLKATEGLSQQERLVLTEFPQ